MHTAKDRQSGKTDEVKCRALVVYATEAANRAAAILAIRTAMNRHYVATHEGEITEKVDKVCGSYWKEGKRDVIPECVQEEIKNAAREKMIAAIISGYDPNLSNGASPITYGGYAADLIAQKRTAMYFAEAKAMRSMDKPIDGGNDGSKEKTYAEATPEPTLGRLPLRVQVDLLLVKEHLTSIEWEVFFECRYVRYMEHADIARLYGWTESRYRWFWKKLQAKLVVLCDLKR